MAQTLPLADFFMNYDHPYSFQSTTDDTPMDIDTNVWEAAISFKDPSEVPFGPSQSAPFPGFGNNYPTWLDMALDQTTISANTSCNIDSTMATSAGNQADIDAQIKAAEDWQPGQQGDHVSAKRPILELVQKYQNSHEAYKTKTTNLPATYDWFRVVKGDRRCGWRAILFRLLEIVLEIGTPQIHDALTAHLDVCGSAVQAMGDIYYELYEGGVEELKGMMQTLKMLPSQDAVEQLRNWFENDAAGYMIYSLRMIASAEIRTHPDDYAPVLEKTLDEYCLSEIEPVEEEIAEPGLRALSDALLRPLGIQLQVVNLHLNPGSNVDVIDYEASPSHAVGGPYSVESPPLVRLFFTPGHYDLIYTKANQVREFHAQPAHEGQPFQLQPDFGLAHDDPLMDHLAFLDPIFANLSMSAAHEKPSRTANSPSTMSPAFSALPVAQYQSVRTTTLPSSQDCNTEEEQLLTTPSIQSPLNRRHYGNGSFEPHVFTPNDGAIIGLKKDPEKVEKSQQKNQGSSRKGSTP